MCSFMSSVAMIEAYDVPLILAMLGQHSVTFVAATAATCLPVDCIQHCVNCFVWSMLVRWKALGGVGG